MSDPRSEYKANVNLIAAVAVGSLLFIVGFAVATGDFKRLWYWLPAWLVYFVLAYVLDGVQEYMIGHYRKDGTNSGLANARTAAFLLWPLYLIFTLLYIPLVLLLRRKLRTN